MIQERYVVYELVGDDTEEISWHYTPEKAQAVAKAHTAKNNVATMIEWVKGDLTPNGWEVLDSEPDTHGGFRPKENILDTDF